MSTSHMSASVVHVPAAPLPIQPSVRVWEKLRRMAQVLGPLLSTQETQEKLLASNLDLA